MEKLRTDKMKVSFLFMFGLLFFVDSASSTSGFASIDSVNQNICLVLAVSAANQDLAVSDAIKISRDVDLKGERTFEVLTKIGTDALEILEGKSYRLQFPCIGVVDCSEADINKSVDMVAACRVELEYFASTPEYRHLAHRMGSEHQGKMLSKILEAKSYRLKFTWIGVVGCSEADINKSVDMIPAPRRERGYFASTPEYRHLARRMDSEHLGKMLLKKNEIGRHRILTEDDLSDPPYPSVAKDPSEEHPTGKSMPLWVWIVIAILGTAFVLLILLSVFRRYYPNKIATEPRGDIEM